jgi:hypothetical protein
MNGKLRPKIWKLILICAVSVLGNVFLGVFVHGMLKAPLFLDTVFTIAVSFSFGLLPGLVTGAVLFPVSSVLHNFLANIYVNTVIRNIYVLCVIVEILAVVFFRVKIRKRESLFFEAPSILSFSGIAAPLLALVAIDCILVSFTGGLIDFLLNRLFSITYVPSPEDLFKLGLLRNNVPALAAAILSRIPINIVDRFIGVFGGYGISLLYRRWTFSDTRR